MPQRRRDSPPPQTGLSEKEVLLGFLDYLRECVIEKVQGVPEPLVRTPGVGSGTNLVGLVKHLTHVERYTFLGEKVADWPATFQAGPDETVESLVADYRDVVARANAVIGACDDLTSPAPRPGRRLDRTLVHGSLASATPGSLIGPRSRPPRTLREAT
ncbi:DUF664 domain-containing protein [Mycobacterium sp. B14F4]|uniref:mycothiol transferase n=1 Tax=Mycobacterium sp. B14F4 TaxID=3153565 RepID=UPI00325EFC87